MRAVTPGSVILRAHHQEVKATLAIEVVVGLLTVLQDVADDNDV
jgi:hypothetical protein